MKIEENNSRNFVEIFQNILKELNVTVYRFAKDIGIGTAPIQKLLEGGKPSYTTLISMLEAYPQLNSDYVLFGRGDVLLKGNANKIGVLGDLETVEVPYLPIKAHATFISTYEESIPLQLETYPVIKNSCTNNCLLIEVNGNSMKPTINHGAKILAEKIERGNWGDVSGVFAVLYKDFFVVKRIRENELNTFNRLTLYSDNINGGTVTIQPSDIREMWKVLSVYHQTIE